MEIYENVLNHILHAPGEEALEGADMEDGADLDYFDVEDLGRLRRSLRKAIGDTQRERELYQEIVQQYIEAGPPHQNPLTPPLAHVTLTKCASVSCNSSPASG